MLGFPSTHRFLMRSPAELEPRDPSLIDIPLPVNSIPVVGPIISPLVGDGGSQSTSNSPSGNPSPSNSPAGNPPAGTTPTSTAGNGNGDNNGGGSNPTNIPTPTSGGDVVSQPVVSSKTTPIPSAGNPSVSTGAQNTHSSSGTASSSSLGGGGNNPSPSGQAASALAGAQSSGVGTSHGALTTNFLEASQSSLGPGSGTAGALSPSSTTASATSAGERLSGGTIAGLIILCLFSLLVLVLLVFRRLSIARRVELRNRWWFNRTHSGSFSSADESRTPVKANGEVSASRLSARSSFATNFDQGLMFRVDSPSRFSPGAVPDYPPIAEVRERNPVLVSTAATLAQRTSLNDMLTHGSDLDAQYLAVSTSQSHLESFTPMSVRPFSPSESFFFPKPPATSSTESLSFRHAQGHSSNASSATTLVQVSTPPPALLIDLPPASGANARSLTLDAALSPLAAAANTSPDPFADPLKHELVVRRPFAPSLDDELMVYRGDQVRILHVFDDGWAFVEKSAGAEGSPREQGLIPLDCLREADQALPTFLTQERGSNGSDHPIGYAL